MLILDALKILDISQADMAVALEVTPGAISKRVNSESELKVSELLILQNYFKKDLFGMYALSNPQVNSCVPDAVEIVYYDNPKLTNIIKTPEVTSIWLDRELVHNKWHKNERDLRTLSMPGDNMNGGDDPIFNGDMLIIDISSTDVRRSGIYAFTTQGETNLFVNILRQRVDGNIEFSHWNSQYSSSIRTVEELKELDFKIIGRMIKSMELFHD